jgi:hypothetical protein
MIDICQFKNHKKIDAKATWRYIFKNLCLNSNNIYFKTKQKVLNMKFSHHWYTDFLKRNNFTKVSTRGAVNMPFRHFTPKIFDKNSPIEDQPEISLCNETLQRIYHLQQNLQIKPETSFVESLEQNPPEIPGCPPGQPEIWNTPGNSSFGYQFNPNCFNSGSDGRKNGADPIPGEIPSLNRNSSTNQLCSRVKMEQTSVTQIPPSVSMPTE